MTDELIKDPLNQLSIDEDWQNGSSQWHAYQAKFSYEQAVNAAALARDNPSASPDVVAALATGGYRWDDNTISQVIAADNHKQTLLQRKMTEVFGPVTRVALAGFEEIYRGAISTPVNVGVRMAQGESYESARRTAGSHLIAQYVRANQLGYKTSLGHGLLPGENPDPLMTPGASEVLLEQMEAGATPEEAISYTEQWVLDNIGYDMMNKTRAETSTTMLHKTKNGETTSYHATPGRVIFQPFTQWIAPDTNPHQFFTGALDISSQFGLDPNNFWMAQLTRMAIGRRTAVGAAGIDGTADELAQGLGGIPLRQRPVLNDAGLVVDPVTGEELLSPGAVAAAMDPTVPWGTVPGYGAHVGGEIEDEFLRRGGVAIDTEGVSDTYWGAAERGGIWGGGLEGVENTTKAGADAGAGLPDQLDEDLLNRIVADGGWDSQHVERTRAWMEKQGIDMQALLDDGNPMVIEVGADGKLSVPDPQKLIAAEHLDVDSIPVIYEQVKAQTTIDSIINKGPTPVSADEAEAFLFEVDAIDVSIAQDLLEELEADPARLAALIADQSPLKVTVSERGIGEIAEDDIERYFALQQSGAEITLDITKPVKAPEANIGTSVEPLIHLLPLDEMPSPMRELIEQYGVQPQYWETKALAEMYPDFSVDELADLQRSYGEATRTVEAHSSALHKTDPQEWADMQAVLWYEASYADGLTGVDPTDFHARFRGRYTISDDGQQLIRTSDNTPLPTTADELVDEYRDPWVFENDPETELSTAMGEWVTAQRHLDNHPLFGPNAVETPATKALQAHIDDPRTLFGGTSFSPRVSASYTKAEWEEMKEIGYIFPTRDQYDLYKGVLDRNIEAGAVKIRGSWIVKPQTIDRFLTQGRGKRFIEWASASERTIDQLAGGIFPGMDLDDIILIAKESDPAVTEEILRSWYGSSLSGHVVPRPRHRVLGGVDNTLKKFTGAERYMDESLGARSGTSYAERSRQRMTNYGKRLFAEMGHNVIDPFDKSSTYRTMRSWAKTLNASDESLDATIELVAKMDGSRTSAKPVVDQMWKWFQEELMRKGYQEAEIKAIITEWNSIVSKQYLYGENPLGEALPLLHGTKETIPSRFGEISWQRSEPILDSQLSIRNFFVPDIRQARRATASLRTIFDHGEIIGLNPRKTLPGLNTSKQQHMVDVALASWRNIALLRPGWIMRVIPDEIGRFYVEGYGEIANSPAAIILMSMGKVGDDLGNGTSLAAMHEVAGLGADNGLWRRVNIRDGGISDTARKQTSVRNANWSLERAANVDPETGELVLTTAGARGIARNILQLHTSDLAKTLAQFDGDVYAALRHLKETPEGRKILSRIANQTETESFLGKGAQRGGEESQQALEHVLQTIEGQRHQFAGGRWIARDPKRPGEWIDMHGKPVELYTARKYTEADLSRILDERGITGPRGGRATGNLDQKRRMLIESDGNPADLLHRPQSDTVIVTRQGKAEILDLISTGRFAHLEDVNHARSRAVRDLFRNRMGETVNRSDYVFVVGESGIKGQQAVKTGGYGAYRDLDVASRQLGDGQAIYMIAKEDLPPSVFIDGKGSARKIEIPVLEGGDIVTSHPIYINKVALDEHQAALMADGKTSYINNDMMASDFEILEQRLMAEYSQDTVPVQQVRVPDKPYVNVEDEKKLIDTLFEYIGRNPSMSIVRRPFVTLRTWDIMAEEYVFATPAVRAQLLKNAEAAGMGRKFKGYVETHLKNRGMTKPLASAKPLTVDQIIELSWSRAIGDTKDLFYDLTKGGAWQDASRLVFPFADAWYEVLSRWAGLMNPVRQGGKPFKFARRIQQVNVGAEQSGFFDTSSGGERVFNIPSTGHFFNWLYSGSSQDTVQINAQVSMDNLLFIDFGNPAKALMPGLSPHIQAAASLFRPLVPTGLRTGFDSVFFGEYGAPERTPTGLAKSFLPTYMRRFSEKLVDGQYDLKYASLENKYLNALIQTDAYKDLPVNQDTALAAIREAQQAVGWIATADIIGSAFSPAQPQNVVELLRVDDEGHVTAMSLAAMGSDWSLLRSIYGEDEALQYIGEMYGVNPLGFAPSTYASLNRPVTKEAFFALEDNKVMAESLPFTLMAWLPLDDGDFYAEAWQAQKTSGARETLDAKDATYFLGHVAGSFRMRKLREQRDGLLETGEKLWGGKDNNAYRALRDDVVGPWYRDAFADLYIQYWAYGPNSGVTGMTNRPSYKEVVGELRQIANPTTEASRQAREANPEVYEFVSFTMGLWEQNERLSVAAGNQLTWWETSTGETSAAQLLRGAFQQGVNRHIGNMSLEGQQHAEWLVQTVFTPLLEGFDFDNPLIIAPTVAPVVDSGLLDKLNER